MSLYAWAHVLHEWEGITDRWSQFYYRPWPFTWGQFGWQDVQLVNLLVISALNRYHKKQTPNQRIILTNVSALILSANISLMKHVTIKLSSWHQFYKLRATEDRISSVASDLGIRVFNILRFICHPCTFSVLCNKITGMKTLLTEKRRFSNHSLVL